MTRYKTIAKRQHGQQRRVRQRTEDPREPSHIQEEPVELTPPQSPSSDSRLHSSACASSSPQADPEYIPSLSPPPAQPAQHLDRPLPRYSRLSVAYESIFDIDFFSRYSLTWHACDDIDRRGILAILATITYPVYPRLVWMFFQNLRPTLSNLAELRTTVDGHPISIIVDTLSRSCRCPHLCPPDLQDTYPTLWRPSYAFMAEALTGLYSEGDTFATYTYLPNDLWFFDSVLYRNVFMVGHKIQRRGDFLTALYAFYTGCWLSIPALIWSVMMKLYTDHISKAKPKRAKFLPFGHLITQILRDQCYPFQPRERPETGSCSFTKQDWNKT
ncbi:uncharacterized protein LOC132267145 [Cornus florida]|uniref:uncharacterized protein LOC132267145 n=1 Tax=Cornus florida TaxID=4283 RepID=UPI00289E257F|nr:uncharacterized protein LOC132267145 [Cornus florida]